MDDVFVYLRSDLPDGITEMVTPCVYGYTIYISDKLDEEHRLKAYEHALEHIRSGHFDIDQAASVQEMEADAHGMMKGEDFQKATLKQIRKDRQAVKNKLKRRTARNKFLEANGVDMFTVAESQWLESE